MSKENLSSHPLQTGIYKHYKGKFYLVLGIAQHSETQESLVVYVPLYEHSGHGMSVRPLAMFLEMVELPVAGGGTTELPRFQYIGNSIE